MNVEKIEGHYIRKSHRQTMPKRYLVLDAETEYEQKGPTQFHRMKLAWTCYVRRDRDRGVTGEHWRYWKSAYLLWKYVDKLSFDKDPLYIFGHNIFFDLQCSDFFRYFTLWGWKRDFIYDSGTTYILCIKNDSRTIKIISTTNYFVASLDSLGAMLGIGKGHPDFGIADEDYLSCYCFRDVEITVAIVEYYIKYIVDNDLGSFGMSRASQAYRAYRHRFMNHRIMHHNNSKLQELERQAYYGGRTECFQLGKVGNGPFVKLDVNSMYPFIMKHFAMPTVPTDYMEAPGIKTVRRILESQSMIAEVELKTDEPMYAVRWRDKVVFPVGKFRTFLCSEGLEQAIERGHLIRVLRAGTYEREIIFEEYVDFFYNKRQEEKAAGNRPGEQACKIFLNALYGKFGQTESIVEDVEYIDDYAYSREETSIQGSNDVEIITSLMGVKTTECGKRPIEGSVLSIPAHVTEYGRMLLWSFIERAGMDNVLYVDTDSITMRVRDVKRMQSEMDNKKLGFLKIEDQFNSLTINGLKDYATEKEVKLKGVPKSAIEVAPRVYEYDYFPRQRTHLAKSIDRFHLITRIRKTLSGIYNKGKKLPSGRVRPLIFPDESGE